MLSSTKKNSFLSRLSSRDLGEDLVDRAGGVCGALEDGLHGAEVALEMAAAAGLDQPDGQIALAAEDRRSGARRRATGGPLAR